MLGQQGLLGVRHSQGRQEKQAKAGYALVHGILEDSRATGIQDTALFVRLPLFFSSNRLGMGS
jgi:hypothetical protein